MEWLYYKLYVLLLIELVHKYPTHFKALYLLQTDLHSTQFWQNLAPQLSINKYFQTTNPITISPEVMEEISRSMEQDSYLLLSSLIDKSETDAIRDCIFSLTDIGLPPVFVYIYDQPWALFERLRPIIELFLGNRFSLLPNFWAWHIPPIKGASGWPAHTDCSAQTRFESADGGTTFMSMSFWIPLTDATIENGCMAILPKSREILYNTPITDPNQIIPQDAINLPAKSGSVIGWSQDLYHWSRHVTTNLVTPRVSLSLEFQNPAFTPLIRPLLNIEHPPLFKEQLALIFSQFEKYKDMEPVNFKKNQQYF
jgi:hypothetical protein